MRKNCRSGSRSRRDCQQCSAIMALHLTALAFFFICLAISLKFPPEAYSHDMVKYIESNLPRESVTRITLLVDTRPHPGYDGNNVFCMWQHLTLLTKMFQHYFPERLARVIAYPVSEFEHLQQPRTKWSSWPAGSVNRFHSSCGIISEFLRFCQGTVASSTVYPNKPELQRRMTNTIPV